MPELPKQDQNTQPSPDEYDGKYKPCHDGKSEGQKFGTDQMPVKDDPPPWSNLNEVGG